jgi:DNA-binding MarR family transcriptional regulator
MQIISMATDAQDRSFTKSSSAPSSLQRELGQRRPFRSRGQEATIALLRTASVVSRSLARVVGPAGLSLAQYNVLRILRGTGSAGLATLAIRDRMIEEGTAITRLLDKLERAGYVRRERGAPDRRQVICYLTDRGRELLGTLDRAVDHADQAAVAMLDRDQLTHLLALLDEIRAGQQPQSNR